jgi:hypothetical protein
VNRSAIHQPATKDRRGAQHPPGQPLRRMALTTDGESPREQHRREQQPARLTHTNRLRPVIETFRRPRRHPGDAPTTVPSTR